MIGKPPLRETIADMQRIQRVLTQAAGDTGRSIAALQSTCVHDWGLPGFQKDTGGGCQTLTCSMCLKEESV